MAQVRVKFLRPHIMLGGVRCQKGEVRDVEPEVAKSMESYGIATVVSGTAGKGPSPSEPEKGDGDLESKTKKELVALAEQRGLEVTREDGQDGAPTKSDYIAALQAADANDSSGGDEGDADPKASEPDGDKEPAADEE